MAVGSQPAASSEKSIRRMWGGGSVPQAKKTFALAVVESVQEFGGWLVREIGRSTAWESGLRRWSGRRFSEG